MILWPALGLRCDAWIPYLFIGMRHTSVGIVVVGCGHKRSLESVVGGLKEKKKRNCSIRRISKVLLNEGPTKKVHSLCLMSALLKWSIKNEGPTKVIKSGLLALCPSRTPRRRERGVCISWDLSAPRKSIAEVKATMREIASLLGVPSKNLVKSGMAVVRVGRKKEGMVLFTSSTTMATCCPVMLPW